MAVRFLPFTWPSGGVWALMGLLALSSPTYADCYPTPLEYLKAHPQQKKLWVCTKQQEKSFCSKKPKARQCEKLDISAQKALLPKGAKKAKNAKMLAAYLGLMKFSGPVTLKDHIRIQTGRYPEVAVNKSIKAPCLKALLETAYKLQRTFPNYNFVLNGRIKKCQNLEAGLSQLLKERSRVQRNIQRFHTPMHSVFFTDTTKFNHFVMGQMGLYINVDKKDEIRRRLIDFQVGRGQIRHEGSPSRRVGGFSSDFIRYSSEPTY